MSRASAEAERVLQREAGRLDALLSEIGLGVRDQKHFDALEERAQRIASGIRAAFRG